MKKNIEGGYTLIESLIVLSAFAILASMSILLLKPQYERIESEVFLAQFQADLLFGQQYAISHQREVTVNLMPENHYYYIHDYVGRILIIERYYQKDINLSPVTLGTYFKFLPDGNVNKFGTISIEIGKRRYLFTIQLGKGRFYVTEE